jgi:hypothetical protein
MVLLIVATAAAWSAVLLSPRRLIGVAATGRTASTTTATATRHAGFKLAGAGILPFPFARHRTIGITGIGVARRVLFAGIANDDVAIVARRAALIRTVLIRTVSVRRMSL